MKFTPDDAFNLIRETLGDQDIEAIILAAAEKVAWEIKESQLAQDIFAVRFQRNFCDENCE